MIKSIQADLLKVQKLLSKSIDSADINSLRDVSIQLRLAHTHIDSAVNHLSDEQEARHGEMVR